MLSTQWCHRIYECFVISIKDPNIQIASGDIPFPQCPKSFGFLLSFVLTVDLNNSGQHIKNQRIA